MIWKVVGVVLYLACLVGIGVYASRRMTSARSYFAGDKSFGFWAGSFSARATGESAWLLLGLTGMGALVGVKAFWVVVGEVLGVLGAWALMAGPFKRLTDRYDSITVPDYLESHFRDTGKTLRLVAAVALVVFVTIYVSAQIDATGTAFESFLGVDYYTGALIGFGVVLAYIVSGGFVAVVWSDVFQGTLMFVGLVALPIVGVTYAGGVGEVTAGLAAIDDSLLSWSGGEGWTMPVIAEVIGLSLIGLGFLGSPQIFVRFLSLKSDKEVLPGGIVAVIWTLLADSGAVCTGLVGRHLLTSRDAEVETVLGNGAQEVLPMLSELVLPPLLIGLVIAIVLSAIMSTVDSLLVLASSAAIRDVYQKVLNPSLPDEALVGMSRIGTAALAACALGVALGVAVLVPGRTVFWFVIFGWSGIAATFCPTMILSLAWRGFNKQGALVAMIVGFLSVPLYKFGAPELPGQLGVFFANLGELPPAFATSMLAGAVVALITRDQ